MNEKDMVSGTEGSDFTAQNGLSHDGCFAPLLETDVSMCSRHTQTQGGSNKFTRLEQRQHERREQRRERGRSIGLKPLANSGMAPSLSSFLSVSGCVALELFSIYIYIYIYARPSPC